LKDFQAKSAKYVPRMNKAQNAFMKKANNPPRRKQHDIETKLNKKPL